MLKQRVASLEEAEPERRHRSPADAPNATEKSPGNRQQTNSDETASALVNHAERPVPGDIEDLADAVYQTAERLQASYTEPTDIERSDFFENIRTYMENAGRLNHNVDLEPKIAERVVDLYKLYNIVSNLEDEVDQTDWVTVSIALGFDPQKIPGAEFKVRKYWICYLQGYYDSLSDDEEEEGGSGDGEVAVEEETLFVDDEHFSPPTLGSSPPLRGTKRGHGLDDLHNGLDRSGPGKKPRRDSTDEIPSTPEDRLGITRDDAEASPSPGAESSTVTPPSEARPARTTTVVEPETQDFVYDVAGDEPPDEDVTPSQQLQAEHAATSPLPIPLRLPRNHRAQSAGGPSPVGRPREAHVSDRGTSGIGNIGQWSANATAARGTPHRQVVEQDGRLAALAAECERFEALGYAEEDVKRALRVTTFDIGLAGEVMEYFRKGHGVPNNMEGVWTDRDDHGLRYVDEQPSDLDARARVEDEATRRQKRKLEWTRLVDKHTQERVEARRKYLSYAKDFT